MTLRPFGGPSARRFRKGGALALAPSAFLASVLATTPAAASTASTATPTAATQSVTKPPATPMVATSSSKINNPAAVLPSGWQKSTDRAVTLVGDADGLHVMVATEKSGYQWQTAATLSEPGFDVDQWIGSACVTGSGRRAAVVYEPRVYTNYQTARDAGGFVAIVNLRTGAVRKLAVRASTAYFNPGCGTGETFAVSTLNESTRTATTSVDVIDASTGKIKKRVVTRGQVTSTVPWGSKLVGVLGNRLVTLSAAGVPKTLTTATGVPFRVHPDAAGGIAYEVPSGAKVQLRRWAGGKSTLVGSGPIDALQLASSAGHVFVIGTKSSAVHPNAATGWKVLGVPSDADVSTTGALAVTDSNEHDAKAAKAEKAPSDYVTIASTVIGTHKRASFALAPAALKPAAGTALSPALARATSRGGIHANVAIGNDPTDPDRGCSIARNDPAHQTLQATANQVEWATDLAVHGDLTITRPANWDGSGMPVSWQIQGNGGLFPFLPVDGPDGSTVPAQVLLGVLAQESNTEQASPHAVDGETGNFNQGGFYGDRSSWNTVDCGYGVGQVTSGMAIADGTTPYTPNEQLAIATDYASNIAASLQLLTQKWNTLYVSQTGGISANGGDPRYIENWYFAAWAYNTGIQPSGPAFGNTTGCDPSPVCTDVNGRWGLGWSNNPDNPGYPADRIQFNSGAPADQVFAEKNPNLWPYQEKVIGWAFNPVARFDYVKDNWFPAYAPGFNNSALPRIPAYTSFCTIAANDCMPGGAFDEDGHQDAGLCLTNDLHCWWHQPANNWLDCTADGQCTTEALNYFAGDPEPPTPTVYGPNCGTTGLPAGASIIDDTTVADPLPGCTKTWTQAGSFGLAFASSTPAGCTSNCINYQSKIDFHQLGGEGFGGHTWFAHTIPVSDPADVVTGTWTLNPTNKWTRILVHLPASGAGTPQAKYVIHEPNGSMEYRVIPTNYGANTWVDIGVFDLRGTTAPTVTLSNVAADGNGTIDIAWDALAYVGLPAKPTNFVVAMGDSYSSGEGSGNYSTVSNQHGDDGSLLRDACRRSPSAYSRQMLLPGGKTTTVGQQADSFDPSLSFGFIACSGAASWNMASTSTSDGVPAWKSYGLGPDKPDGRYNEAPELDQGWLDKNTTLVTLNAGGNDATFAKTVQGCALGPCDLTGLAASIENQVSLHVHELVAQIRALAPNARIIVVGYPQLFNSGGSLAVDYDCGLDPVCQSLENIINFFGYGIDVSEAAELNQFADLLRDYAVPNDPAHGVYGIDPEYLFTTEAISNITSSDDLNALTAPECPDLVKVGCPPSTNGEQSSEYIGMGSFHPTPAGQRAYAVAVDDVLLGLPVGQWNLDEGTGSTGTDSSGFGHNAALTSTTWTTGHLVNTKAASFNGTSSFGATSASIIHTNQNYTVSAWVKLASTAKEAPALTQIASDGVRSGFYLEYQPTGNVWRFQIPHTDVASPTWYRADAPVGAHPTGAWTNLTATYNLPDKTMRLYVDGKLVATTTNVFTFDATGVLRIGRSENAWFNGQIGNVQVWNRTLTDTEVAANAAPHVASYSLVDGSNVASATLGDWTFNNATVPLTGGYNFYATGFPMHHGDLGFDGSTGYAAHSGPLLNTAQSYSVNAWVNLSAAGAERTAISQNSATGNNSGFYLEYKDTCNCWRFQVAKTDATSPTYYDAVSDASHVPAVGQWTMLTGVYDAAAGTISLYVNGALQSTVTATTFNATGDFRLGRSGSTWWSGTMNSVDVYQGALIASQISAMYNTAVGDNFTS